MHIQASNEREKTQKGIHTESADLGRIVDGLNPVRNSTLQLKVRSRESEVKKVRENGGWM